MGASLAAVLVPLYQNDDRRREQREQQLLTDWTVSKEAYRVSSRLWKVGESVRTSFEAPPSLESVIRAKEATAPILGPVAGAAGAVLCQAATEWLSGHEESEGQAGQADAAPIPGPDPSV